MKRKLRILVKYDKLDEAEKILEKNVVPDELMASIKMEILAKKGKKEELRKYYEGLEWKTETLEVEYSQHMDDYQRVYEILVKKKDIGHADLVLCSFAMLRLGKYKEAYDLLKPYYDNPHNKTGEIIINFLYANTKHLNKKVEKQLEKIINEKKYNDRVECCAYAMLNKTNEALRVLKKIIKKDPGFRYEALRWPVLENMKSVDEFKQLVNG